jgi:Bax protein
MGKTRLASGLRLGALVAIALLSAGRVAVALDANPHADHHEDSPLGEPLKIHWASPEPRPAQDLATIAPEDADRLDAFFERQGFLLSGVREGGRTVPRVSVTQLPQDLEALRKAERRKALFLRSVLPLVLMSNEELRSKRGRLLALRERVEAGGELAEAERTWLAGIAEDYGASPVPQASGQAGPKDWEPRDFDDLLLRVDEVPPSLALGQSILESGWGTSRFAVEGNALFGETTPTTDTPHLVQGNGSGKRFRAFDSLMESVRAYMHNLNTHRAYRKFRSERAAQRARGVVPNGRLLLPTLERYAELPEYLTLVRSLIRTNRLEELDGAQLDRDWFASRDLSF